MGIWLDQNCLSFAFIFQTLWDYSPLKIQFDRLHFALSFPFPFCFLCFWIFPFYFLVSMRMNGNSSMKALRDWSRFSLFPQLTRQVSPIPSAPFLSSKLQCWLTSNCFIVKSTSAAVVLLTIRAKVWDFDDVVLVLAALVDFGSGPFFLWEVWGIGVVCGLKKTKKRRKHGLRKGWRKWKEYAYLSKCL